MFVQGLKPTSFYRMDRLKIVPKRSESESIKNEILCFLYF
ncbi:hypothetical protein LEP1GSC020_1767 [Leptospira interrogans serovar Grippotyphosa str. 2006006986]|nr:hypothetical protein LEP1GSC020_1767 [Leptospira interrogans serovar Grippotyphosa str. 2006006986]